MKGLDENSTIYNDHADYIKTMDAFRDGYNKQFPKFYYPENGKMERMRQEYIKVMMEVDDAMRGKLKL